MADLNKTAQIIFQVIAQPTEYQGSFLLAVNVNGASYLISETQVASRSNPGEFTGLISDQEAVAENLTIALQEDYSDSQNSGSPIAELPIKFSYISPRSIVIWAQEYGVVFTATSIPSWIRVTGSRPEDPPEEEDLLLDSISVSEADSGDPKYSVKWTLNFQNAVYPVQLTSPGTKTINDASEAYYDFLRNSSAIGGPNLNLTATDADGKVLNISHPKADYWSISAPDVTEQYPGYTVKAEKSLTIGAYRAIFSYKLDDGTWRGTPDFYNVGIGAHIMYIKDNWGSEQSIEFNAGELEERIIYFANPEQRNIRKATITNPEYTPERVNMYVVFPGLNKEVKRSLIPIEVETGVFEADFDINNLLYGELLDYLEDIEQFTFPADLSAPVTDRTNKMLEFYTDESYTYLDDNAEPQEADRTDNSANTHHYAIAGGVDHSMLGYLNQEDKRFDEWLIQDTTLLFLSWIPDNMPVHPNQPLRIWLLNNGFISGMQLKSQVTYTDGTVSDEQSLSVTSTGFGLFEICCGLTELGLNALDISKTAASYKFWIEGFNGAIPVTTEVKSITVDNEYYERNDILFFPTSLGVHEVMWCHGRRSENREMGKEQNFKPLTTPNMQKGTIRALRGTLKHSFSMNTGWFPKAIRHYLADLVSAGEAVLPVNFFLMPVLIGDGKFGFGDDDEDLFAISFEMGVAHENRHYTPIPEVESPWGSFSDDFNEDFFI